MQAVVIPLLLLSLDVALEDMRPKCGLYNLVGLECFEGVAERARERRQRAGTWIDVVQILLGSRRRRQLALNAIQARFQHDREDEIRIRGWIRTAELDACRLRAAGADAWDANQRRAVGAAPAYIDRRLIAQHQALVGVHQWGQDGGHALGMLQQSGNIVVRNLRETTLVVGIIEGVLAGRLIGQALVDMHTGAVNAGDRLRHEGRVQAVLLCDRLQRDAERDRLVGNRQRIAILEVDLMLADRNLVVTGLDDDPEDLQRLDHLAANMGREVGRDVKVSRGILRHRIDRTVGVRLEEEEFELRAGIEVEAHLLGLGHHVLERTARIAGERIALGRVDITDETRRLHFRLTVPRNDCVGIEVGHKVHIAFGDPRKSLDRRAVEPDAMIEHILDLADRNRHILDDADDVGKLQVEELDVLLLNQIANLVLRVTHVYAPKAKEFHNSALLPRSVTITLGKSYVQSIQRLAPVFVQLAHTRGHCAKAIMPQMRFSSYTLCSSAANSARAA